MANSATDKRQLVSFLFKGLGPFLLEDFTQWLNEDPVRRERAVRLLQILQRDKQKEFKVRLTDLFRSDHLPFSEINIAARERKNEKEGERPHLKTCTICNAFVETEAALLIIRGAMRVDLSGLAAKIPEAPTDNQTWFGKRPGSR